MKYSTRNLNEPGIRLPFPFPIKLIIEYRPDGVLVDYAPSFYSADPEGAADKVVQARGWDRRPEYRPQDVWVDGAF